MHYLWATLHMIDQLSVRKDSDDKYRHSGKSHYTDISLIKINLAQLLHCPKCSLYRDCRPDRNDKNVKQGWL